MLPCRILIVRSLFPFLFTLQPPRLRTHPRPRWIFCRRSLFGSQANQYCGASFWVCSSDWELTVCIFSFS